jgi:hypothetical protein
VHDGIIAPGECADPEDLSAVADLIFEKTNSQVEVVNRAPVAQMRTAEPNEGYRLLAALVRERVVLNVLTLNYDLAMATALAGGNNEISIIHRPEDSRGIKAQNVIYLHRSAYDDADKWIMRTAELERQWENNWQQIIAQRALAAPVILFIGLGSPAAVLTSTVAKIKAAVPAFEVFQADIGAYGTSSFTTTLQIQEDHYIRASFSEIANAVGHRFVTASTASLELLAEELAQRNRYAREDVTPLLTNIQNLGLLTLGKVRARFILSPASYSSRDELSDDHLADLVHGISALARHLRAQIQIMPSGECFLTTDGKPVALILAATGRGILTYEALEPRCAEQKKNSSQFKIPILTALSGIQGEVSSHSSPQSIVEGDPRNDITGSSEIIVDLSILRRGDLNLEGLLPNE